MKVFVKIKLLLLLCLFTFFCHQASSQSKTGDIILQQTALSFYANGEVIASVFYNTTGGSSSGYYLPGGKQVTDFSNQTEVVPFSLENKLRERDLHINLVEEWRENVIIEQSMVTEQSPQSAYNLARIVISLLLI